MKMLIIDTATNSGSLVLAENEEVKSNFEWKDRPQHAEVLADNIRKILSDVGWKISDIEGVGVALGPGSFTGLRIGLATAKGVCAGLNIPIAGFSTLDALIKSKASFNGIVVATVDARRKEIYAKAFDFRKDKIVFDAKTISPPDFKKWLYTTEKPVLLIGNGAMLYSKEFEMIGVTVLDLDLPNAEVVSKMVFEKLKQGGDDIDLLVPLYIRMSDAEIGFLGKVEKI